MNSAPSKPTFGRVAMTLGLATIVAGLMLLAAWLKQSAPAGSGIEALWETAIFALAIVGLFIPILAMRLPGPAR